MRPAVKLLKQDADAVMVVLPSDHYIQGEKNYTDTLLQAVEMADRRRCIVTLGIHPSRPETGYGYIEMGERSTGNIPTYRIARFTEKPNLEVATDFYYSNNYLQNELDMFKHVHELDGYSDGKNLKHSGQTIKGYFIVKDRFNKKATSSEVDYTLYNNRPPVVTNVENEKVMLGIGFGAMPGNTFIKSMRDAYENYTFVDKQGRMNLK